MNFLAFTSPKVSQKLTTTFFTFLQTSISMKLGKFLRIEAWSHVKSVCVLRNKIFQKPCFLKSYETHMSKWWNSLCHLYHIFVWFIRDFLRFFLPSSGASFEYSIDSRSKIGNSTSSTDTSPCKSSKMFALKYKFG
jgi:hypothetical protein